MLMTKPKNLSCCTGCHLCDFVGQYYQKIDDKRRLVLPSGIIATIEHRNPEDYKTIYLLLAQTKNSPCPYLALYDVRGYNAIRSKYPGSMLLRTKIDPQNRLLIPETAAEHAGIEKLVAVVASHDKTHVQIWNNKLWEQQQGSCKSKP